MISLPAADRNRPSGCARRCGRSVDGLVLVEPPAYAGVVTFRPLSKRGMADPRFDEPQLGLPDYLFQPVVDWINPLLWQQDPVAGPPEPRVEALRTMQAALRMDPPLDWSVGGDGAIANLVRRMGANREFALDVLDFIVQYSASAEYADELGETLIIAGSEWEVAVVEEGSRQLGKRAVGPVREGIDAIRTPSQRAHHHLTRAWGQLTGRKPDASGVYREAIKAVEAAARPVVSPQNDRTTLGTIIRDLRAKPEKWEVVLDGLPAVISSTTRTLGHATAGRRPLARRRSAGCTRRMEAFAASHLRGYDPLMLRSRICAVRDDVAAGELATYCLSSLAAAGSLPSKAAVRRLVSVTLVGLRTPG